MRVFFLPWPTSVRLVVFILEVIDLNDTMPFSLGILLVSIHRVSDSCSAE